MDEKRTCKTCAHYNDSAYYCRARDMAEAEWNTCSDHETWEENQERLRKCSDTPTEVEK